MRMVAIITIADRRGKQNAMFPLWTCGDSAYSLMRCGMLRRMPDQRREYRSRVRNRP